MRKCILLLLFLSVSVFSITIAIQPLGNIEPAYVEIMKKGLIEAYANITISVEESRTIPQNCYYKPRNRYRAEKILDWLDEVHYEDSISLVIGVTTVDISTTKGNIYDWGIFGLGTLDGFSSVISTYRLRKGVTKEKLLDRIRKLAIHEVGHTYGLEHCPRVGCVMQDCKGSIKPVDQETGEFCTQCLKDLKFIHQKSK